MFIKIIKIFFLIKNILKKNKNCKIQFNDENIFFLSFFFKKENIVLDVHENIYVKIQKFNFLYKIILLKFFKIIFKKFKFIIAEKSYSRYDLFKNYHACIQNFPDIKINAKCLKKNNKILKLVYCGTGNHLLLKYLEIFEILKFNYKIKCQLDIYTDYSIQNIIHKRNFRNIKNVNFYERIDNKELLKKLKKYNFGFAFYEKEENYSESYPTKIFEYIYCNIIPISSNFKLYKNLFKDLNYGEVIIGNNSLLAAKKIKKIWLGNYSNYTKNHINIYKSDFKWSKEEPKLFRIYNN